MKKVIEMNYETPQVEVITVEVEQGFATSAGGEGVIWPQQQSFE